MDQIAPSMNTILKNQKIEIIADAEAMSRAAAELLIEHIAESLHTQEVYSIALSGGATPRRLYALLADDRDLRRQIPWERIHFFWGDERHVPPDHPDSNYRMADTALLSKVPVPKANIHRIPAENPDAAKAAADYEQEIRRFFNIESGQVPRFNCVLLGMGSDGHTASLFPGTAALAETQRLVVSNWVKKFQSYRITLSLPVINNAAYILFLVAGREKADTLKAVLEADSKTMRFPVQYIKPTHGQLTWLLDRPAASRLKTGN
jgi:6-phosphogluconolactonase